MSDLEQLIDELMSANVQVSNEQGELKIKAAKGVVTPSMLAKLKAHKSELLAFLSEQQDRQQNKVIPKHGNYTQPAPLSFSQQRLWFLDKLQGNSIEYNIPVALEVSGTWDIAAANRAMTQLLERQTALRTRFIQSAEQLPQQLVVTVDKFQIQQRDISEAPEQLDAILAEEALKPFDLSRDLMIRASYLKLSDDKGILMFTVHHIASDGWSMDVLFTEFRVAYLAALGHSPVNLVPLPVQYMDYARWQQERLNSDGFARQLSYWQEQLTDIPHEHGVPLDYARKAKASQQGEVFQLQLPQSTIIDLENACGHHGISPFVFLHGAFSYLLSRHSNQSDIVIGTPVANRDRAELKDLIGFFVNTLALRANCDGKQTIADFLSNLKTVNQQALANQDVPLELLIEKLQLPRALNHAPLFQMLLTVSREENQVLETANLRFAPVSQAQTTSKFDISLNVTLSENGPVLRWVYDPTLFKRSRIQTFARHLTSIITEMLAQPHKCLGDINMLDDSEVKHLLRDLNDTQKVLTASPFVHQWVSAQAAKTPDKQALILDHANVTYQQLETASNQLAHLLQSKNIGVGQRVGILAERSIEMVVAILGILKSGAAYVPLDPDYPLERLQYMVKDSGAALILSQSHVPEALTNELPADFLCMNQADGSFVWETTTQLTPPNTDALQAESSAYLIYTSGSTGQPKGVDCTHLGLANRVDWMQSEYQLNQDDRILQKTPFCFDVSVWEFVWPLTFGGSLVMARPGGHKDPAYLAETINRNKVSLLHFVPSMLQHMLISGQWHTCCSVRAVFCSGEALSKGLQDEFYATATNAQLHNLYGPTEAAIDVSYYYCDPKAQLSSVPIGRPIQNTQLLVLNEDLQLVPQGTPGELYIGGPGLAKGYLNKTELTAERFIANPFSKETTARLYKTGDKVRLLADGNIDYLGRLDDQVKIRGFRIEPGEIAQKLQSHESVQQAAVVVQKDSADSARLVAYVVSQSEQQESTLNKSLKAFLAASLPDYMIPSQIIQLAKLPVTANGKLDRKALPEPESELAVEAYIAPNSNSEKVLAKIWADLLNLPIDKISASANFFESGGHSLLAVRLVGAIGQAFAPVPNIQLDAIFDYPRLQELAEQIDIHQLQQQNAANHARLAAANNLEEGEL